MRILGKLLTREAGLAACTLALGAAGCGRPGGPAAEQQREVPSAPSAAAVDGPDVSPSAAALPSGESLGKVGREPALTPVTAAQLRSSIVARGKRGTLVNAWASWCGPCRRELPMLQALSINLKPQQIEIVLVSVDDPKDEPKAVSYLRDNGITLESYVVQGSIADFKVGLNPGWPGMLPASFLFDASGRLVHFWGGEAFESEITAVTDAFLAGRAVAPETRYGLAPGKLE
jgi:thiol-disulfide isomerase/thioredoxin